jgi:DNA replication protein DnaC
VNTGTPEYRIRRIADAILVRLVHQAHKLSLKRDSVRKKNKRDVVVA